MRFFLIKMIYLLFNVFIMFKKIMLPSAIPYHLFMSNDK